LSWAAGVEIDFTDSGTGGAWDGANGQLSFLATVGVVDATLTAAPAGATLTTNNSSSEINGCTSAGAGFACGGDGIGINNDEVTGGTTQKLTLTLSTAPSISLNLNSISFLDLFIESTGAEKVDFEVFTSSGSNTYQATANTSGNGGYFNWVASSAIEGVEKIVFSSPGNAANDFALASVNLTTVPLPAAAWLFGSALIGLVAVSRRKTVLA
jgi:hypothetical protein